jgi:hypothetical protein
MRKREWMRQRRRDARAFAARLRVANDHNIIGGDMTVLWDRLRDDSVDLFLTDSPWAEIDCYRRLAELAAAKLRAGGLCLCYTGKMELPAVIESLGKHLTDVRPIQDVEDVQQEEKRQQSQAHLPQDRTFLDQLFVRRRTGLPIATVVLQGRHWPVTYRREAIRRNHTLT